MSCDLTRLDDYHHLVVLPERQGVVMMHSSREPDILVCCHEDDLIRVTSQVASGGVVLEGESSDFIARIKAAGELGRHSRKGEASYEAAVSWNKAPALCWDSVETGDDLKMMARQAREELCHERRKPERLRNLEREEELRIDALHCLQLAEEFNRNEPWDEQEFFFDRVKHLYGVEELPERFAEVGVHRTEHCTWILRVLQRTAHLIKLHEHYQQRATRYA
jgi:hypothetical protein